MQALTVKNPWARAITHFGKNVENRGRNTTHRGDFAVHAGRTLDREALGDPRIVRALNRWWGDAYRTPGPHPWETTPGAIVAVANLAAVCTETVNGNRPACTCGQWAITGQHHWILDNIRPLTTPVPCRGALGLWTVPAELEPLVLERAA